MLDLTQAPYNITQPYTSNDDSSAPDYGPAIMQANDDLANGNWGRMDTGGADGGRMILPPFTVSTSIPIRLHDGVSIEGHSHASSRLTTRDNFPATGAGNHIIALGDIDLPRHASFGGQVKNMIVSAKKGLVAAPGNYCVFSDSLQDSGYIFDNCRIDGGTHFGAVKYVHGIGGASIVKMRDLEVISRKDALALGNLPMVIDVSGSTMVTLEEIEPTCGWVDDANQGLGAVPGSFGIAVYNGDVEIYGVHAEGVQFPIWFGDGGSHNNGYNRAHVERITGGAGNLCLVRVDGSTKWKDQITLKNIMKKTPSIPNSLSSNQPGVPSRTADISDQIRV